MGCTAFKTYKKSTFKVPLYKEADFFEKRKRGQDDLDTIAGRDIIDYLKVIRAPIMILEENPLYIRRKVLIS